MSGEDILKGGAGGETTSSPAAAAPKRPKVAKPAKASPPSASPDAGASSDGGLRAATTASRIEHDGETFPADELIPLTRDAFEALRETGALVEAAWEDCTEV